MNTDSVSKTSAQSAERPLVVSAKQQAKRLLRLAKKAPLEVNALSQALELVSQMHGYPTWQALSKSTGQPAVPEPSASQKVEKALGNRMWAIDGADHVERLAGHARRWASEESASVNIITPHFEALKAMPGMEGVRFVPASDLLKFNPLVVPLGSKAMLPTHRYLLSTLFASMLSPGEQELVFHGRIGRALVDFFKTAPSSGCYAPGLVNGAFLPKLSLTTTTTWDEVRDACIDEGRWEEAFMFPPVSPFGVESLTGMLSDNIKLDLDKRINGYEKLAKMLGQWVKEGSPRESLAPGGVVVFEVDPHNLDWELSPSNQWMIAAYLGHVRRMANAVAKERSELPRKAYASEEEDLLWVRSMPSAQRAKTLDWYGSQTPEVLLDIWDEVEGPFRSFGVKNFAEQIHWANEKFTILSKQAGTWLAYRPEKTPSGLSFDLKESRLVSRFLQENA